MAGGRRSDSWRRSHRQSRGSAIVAHSRTDESVASVNDGAHGRRRRSRQPRAGRSTGSRSAARAPGTPPVPWIVGNPIYVGAARAPPAPPADVRAGSAVGAVRRHARCTGRIEQHRRHRSTRAGADRSTPTNTALTSRGGWAMARRAGQYAAMAVPLPATTSAAFDRDRPDGRSAAPMRVSVQLRIPHGAALRWQRSVYLDATSPRDVSVAAAAK